MNKKNYSLIFAFLILSMCLCFAGCSDRRVEDDIWKNATYSEDVQLGDGDTCVVVEVSAKDKSVTFTINTDKETLGDALLEHSLISGEKGAYGLYVKFVNGIEADYDKTKSFWAISKDGQSLLTGVDGEKISDGNKYEIVYTQQ